MLKQPVFQPKNLFFIMLGAAIYAFGFVTLKMPNQIADSGMTGVTLILHALFGLNPTLTGYLINLPLILLGAKLFGRQAVAYTLLGTFSLYFFIWFWQKAGLVIDVQGDDLITVLLAGLLAGLGGGLVFRYGGTIGGSDIIARVLEAKLGFPLGKSLLGIDVLVMLLSLTYVSVPKMMYALMASFIYSQVVNVVETGGYSLRQVMVITDQHEQIAQAILRTLGRGVTYLNGQGAYSGKERQVLYVIVNPNEVREMKVLVTSLDPQAFLAISNVDEVVSPEFMIKRSKYRAVGGK